MGPSRFRALLLLAFLFLAGLALSPRTELSQRIEALCEPARALRLLATPIGWISTAEVRAAERSLLEGEGDRRAEARRVLAAAQTSAAPSERALAEKRGILHAEVVEQLGDDRDHLLVRFSAGAGARPGMPVVCGDSFVGKVASVDDPDGTGRVDLITAKDFRVGSEIRPPAPPPDAKTAPAAPTLLVVGGVVPHAKGEEILLAAHCPSDPRAKEGEVRVHELEDGAEDPYRALADGYLIGWIERAPRGDVLAVRAAVDYVSGLSHVGILCPAEHAPTGPDLARDPFDEAHWTAARFSLAGDASFWRETRIVSCGSSSSVADGAAVAFGSNLLGCVDRAGKRSSRVRLLGDPGLEILAMACVVPKEATATGDDPAFVLPVGKLVSLDRDRSDRSLLLRWDPSVRVGRAGLEGTGARSMPMESDLDVILYTASGRRSVPPGLRIGRTVLPRGRGPFVLRVRQEEDGLGLLRGNVWREDVSAETLTVLRGDRRP